jgi:hypothetical protein
VASPHVVYFLSPSSLSSPSPNILISSYPLLYYVSPVSPIIKHLISIDLPPIPVYKSAGPIQLQSDPGESWSQMTSSDLLHRTKGPARALIVLTAMLNGRYHR